MRRPARLALAVAAVLLLAGCAAGARAGEPIWTPAPSFQGEPQQPRAIPDVPQPSAPPRASGPDSSPPSPTGSSTDDPSVVATNLTAPDAIALLPDGTALVGERTTGRIVSVQATPHQPVKTVRTLTGLSTTAGGGLLDLALSPTYSQDNLIFAYVTTATDNRVVEFTLTGPMTPVLTGVPRGASDNTGRLAFGDDGRLYVGTGDAGQPSLAADPGSLAGKVLRASDIGQPAAGNPAPSSPVFTTGHHDVAALCLIPQTNVLLEAEPNGANGLADVNVLTAGRNYGWPSPSASSKGPLASMPAGSGSPGGCAVFQNTLYVTSLDGRSLLAAHLGVSGQTVIAAKFQVFLKNQYGRLLTVVAAPDGALWMTTSNRDGHGAPIAADERVLRIQAPAGASANYPG